MDIDKLMFFVPAILISIFAAYYAMKFTANRRYAREEREERAERERKRVERKAQEGQ